MGTRQLQKAQAELLANEVPDEEPEEEISPVKPKFNPFDLLSDDNDAEDEEDTEAEPQESDSKPAAAATPPPPPPTNKSSKRKSKGRKGGKGKAPAAPSQTSATDIDDVLQSLAITSPASASVASIAEPSAAPDVLAINPKHLNPREEMRALFGKSVAQLEKQAARESQASARHGGRARGRRPIAGSAARAKPLILTQSQDDLYSRHDGSLTMEVLQDPEGSGGVGAGVLAAVGCRPPTTQLFEYRGNLAYRTVALQLEQARGTFDPNNVAAVLAHYPFHVEALLAVHDIHMVTNAVDYAGAMLERALIVLETAWHVQFKAHLQAGTARLPLRQGANAVFYAVCERNVRALARRGCHRTALEWSKMLLSLNRNDPCGLLFQIDYFALRAAEFQYIGEVMQRFEGPAVPSSLPNFLYSHSLAQYYLYRQSREDSDMEATATGVHAAGENMELDGELAAAILTFPTVVVSLVKMMQDKGAARSAAWTSTMNRSLFQHPHGGASATLNHLAELFATRNMELWKAPDVSAWLLRCMGEAADAADDPAAGTAGGLAYTDAVALVDITYPPSDRNEYAHCHVTNYSDSTAVEVPQELLDAAAPPAAAVAQAPEGAQRDGGRAAAGGGQDGQQRADTASQGGLLQAVMNMLPWGPWSTRGTGSQAQEAEAEPQADSGEGGQAEGDVEQVPGLRTQLEALMQYNPGLMQALDAAGVNSLHDLTDAQLQDVLQSVLEDMEGM